MRQLQRGMRVIVKAVGQYDDITITPTAGLVVRERVSDNGAWVELDERLDATGVHPFPADDTRARHVCAYPDNCDRAPFNK